MFRYSHISKNSAKMAKPTYVISLRQAVIVKNADGFRCPASKMPPTITISVDPSNNTAFFSLHFPIEVRRKTRGRIKGRAKGKAKSKSTGEGAVYIHIAPESIISITRDEDDIEEASKPKRGAPATIQTQPPICLRFSLSRPARLIGSIFKPPSRTKNTDLQMLQFLEDLATQNALSVHIPEPTLSDRQVETICSISPGHLWKSCPRNSELKSLYGGTGGELISGGSPPPTSGEEAEHLPLHDECDELAAPMSPRPKRTRSMPSSEAPKHQSKDFLAMQNACKEMVAHQQAELRRDMMTELGDMEKRMMDAVSQGLNERLTELKDNIVHELIMNGVEEMVPVAVEHIKAMVKEFVNERVGRTRVEALRRIQEELRTVEDTLWERMSTWSWHCTRVDD